MDKQIVIIHTSSEIQQRNEGHSPVANYTQAYKMDHPVIQTNSKLAVVLRKQKMDQNET
jgi:hypothetical protein